ncbi:hypothetical protein GXP71_12650 [Cellulomonas sp. H30R-01]|uniref:hypothetical protein n=1 Tax=Cellulomonas sp. H30R-01 TaxID=2704467 RepID=UPI00138CA97C|nr:hypothetical protein [Cellulomonas sp. H30R-01]QHT56841.1 hypothetical protein GXP71_12650 [Cellulomonas sp. H30R-01]
MHPELYLMLHQQRQRELDRALAAALVVRERTASATRTPKPRRGALVRLVADARRSLTLALQQRVAVTADRSPAACCAA